MATDVRTLASSVDWNGDWYIQLSGTGAYKFLHFGATGDEPVPRRIWMATARTTLWSSRPSNGDWYWLLEL